MSLSQLPFAKAEHVPYLVGWVREFLRFARDKTGHKFETVIEMFRCHLEQNPRITDWQVRQAIDAVIIYRRQFRESRLPDAPSSGLAPGDTRRDCFVQASSTTFQPIASARAKTGFFRSP